MVRNWAAFKNLWRIGTPLYLLAVSVGLLGLGGWLTYQHQQLQKDYTGAVRHTNEVLDRLNEVGTALREMESNLIRYRLTRQAVFLTAQQTALQALDQATTDVAHLLQDNPVQRRNLRDFNTVLAERLRTSQTSQAGSMKEEFLESKVFLDEMTSRVFGMHQEETRLLETRTARQTEASNQGSLFTAATLLLALVLLGISFGQILFQFNRRRRSEAALQQKVVELERSNEELERFAYVASHDLQEPLRKVRAFSAKLQSKQKALLSPEGGEWLGKIESAAARMQTLINDLLNFSRLISSKDERVPLALKSIADEAVHDLSEAIRASNARLEVGALPRLAVYPFQMRQLFQNLLSNAIKFRKPDLAPVVRVTHQLVKGPQPGMPDSVSMEQRFHAIAVIDNGIGFEQRFADRIMIIFQRLHGVLDYTGTGIGLAICKKVATNHGGYLTATSELGQGATFTLYLPVEG